jgi:transcription antitermination factor NusA-like protein/predicted RNA-binding Zn-ribbon protein involved in translation (DUF1610 family)
MAKDYIGRILEGVIEEDMQNKWLVYFGNEQIDGLLRKDQVPWITDVDEVIDGLLVGKKKTPNGEIYDVDRSERYLMKLSSELPCVKEGYAVIKKVARIPGEKTKVLVAGDAGLFIGQWGRNTEFLLSKLHDKSLDVIQDTGNLSIKGEILEALNIHKMMLMEVDEFDRQATVHLPRSMMGAAYGRNKANLKLAEQLTDFHIELKQLRDPFIYDNEFPEDVVEDLVKNRLMSSNDLYYLITEGYGQDKLRPETIAYIQDTLQPGEDQEEYECPECGKVFYGELERCPYCGVTIEFEEEDDDGIG